MIEQWNSKILCFHGTTLLSQSQKILKSQNGGRYQAREHITKIQLLILKFPILLQRASNAKQLKSKIPKLK